MCSEPVHLSRVGDTSPREVGQEKHTSSAEQENADEVQFLEYLPFRLSVDVELVVRRRVVEEMVENDGDATDDDAKVVTPPPPGGRVLNEGSGNGLCCSAISNQESDVPICVQRISISPMQIGRV